tara:strand:+ start:3393 stop:3740 length:348 start_codon:yes stop_codon:yes gene_type:complete
MAKKRQSLKSPRLSAYNKQKGHCFYCGHPMWLDNPSDFSAEHKISLKQASKFQCTGEHLMAFQDGGSSSQKNIVAACIFCNQTRHKRKNAPSPIIYKALVQKRVRQGKWNCSFIH